MRKNVTRSRRRRVATESARDATRNGAKRKSPMSPVRCTAARDRADFCHANSSRIRNRFSFTTPWQGERERERDSRGIKLKLRCSRVRPNRRRSRIARRRVAENAARRDGNISSRPDCAILSLLRLLPMLTGDCGRPAPTGLLRARSR